MAKTVTVGRARKMRIGMANTGKVPIGWSKSWAEIRKISWRILREFEALGAKQINWRLNESKPEASPVFIDWVAVKEINDCLRRKSGIDDIGRYRFLDPVPSEVYVKALKYVNQEIIVRDWDPKQLFTEKRVESQLLVQKAGLMHQRFIGIVAEQGGVRRCVGTLTVSFKKTPGKNLAKKIDAKMKEWASWGVGKRSQLASFLEQNFVLGGPEVKSNILRD